MFVFKLFVSRFFCGIISEINLRSVTGIIVCRGREGFYSVHNSYDICALFDKIKPFMTPEEDYLYVEKLEGIRKVFQESIQINTVVTIR